MWSVSVFTCVWVVLCVHFACSEVLDTCSYVSYSGGGSHKDVNVLEALQHKTYTCDDREHPEYHYKVSICADLQDELKSKTGGGDVHAGAIQYIKGENNVTTHNLGSMDQTDFMRGTNWVKLEYRNGDSYHSRCNKEQRRTVLFIICDERESQGKLQHIEENTEKDNECYYLFELSHKAVCEIKEPGSLGVGAIVSIVFFVVVGAYLMFGFLYQRFVNHAVGKEQIPNIGFWQDAGNLAADGCNMVFRTNDGIGEARQYRGIGDDQLRNTHEDPPSDTDEHLLPM